MTHYFIAWIWRIEGGLDAELDDTVNWSSFCSERSANISLYDQGFLVDPKSAWGAHH